MFHIDFIKKKKTKFYTGEIHNLVSNDEDRIIFTGIKSRLYTSLNNIIIILFGVVNETPTAMLAVGVCAARFAYRLCTNATTSTGIPTCARRVSRTVINLRCNPGAHARFCRRVRHVGNTQLVIIIVVDATHVIVTVTRGITRPVRKFPTSPMCLFY